MTKDNGNVLVICKHNIKDGDDDYICDLNLTYNIDNIPACKISRYNINDDFACDGQQSFYVSWTEFITNRDKLIEVKEEDT